MKRKLSRKSAPRKLLLKNLVTSLILHEKIKTTVPKAKEVKSKIERLISRSKKNDLTALRYLLRFLPKNAARKMVEDISPSFKKRESGYVKMVRIQPRPGDNAQMALIFFAEREKPAIIKEEKAKHKVKKETITKVIKRNEKKESK